jgi:hypothetical protein
VSRIAGLLVIILLASLVIIMFAALYRQFAPLMLAMWIPTTLCYGLTKAVILRIGGLRIREVYFGIPVGVLSRFRYRGVTYVFTAFPLLAFVFYEGLMPARTYFIPWSDRLSQITSRRKVLGLVLGVIAPLALLAVASTAFFATAIGYPISYGNVRVSSLSVTSPFAQQGVGADDIIVQVGEARVS